MADGFDFTRPAASGWSAELDPAAAHTEGLYRQLPIPTQRATGRVRSTGPSPATDPAAAAGGTEPATSTNAATVDEPEQWNRPADAEHDEADGRHDSPAEPTHGVSGRIGATGKRDAAESTGGDATIGTAAADAGTATATNPATADANAASSQQQQQQQQQPTMHPTLQPVLQQQQQVVNAGHLQDALQQQLQQQHMAAVGQQPFPGGQDQVKQLLNKLMSDEDVQQNSLTMEQRIMLSQLLLQQQQAGMVPSSANASVQQQPLQQAAQMQPSPPQMAPVSACGTAPQAAAAVQQPQHLPNASAANVPTTLS